MLLELQRAIEAQHIDQLRAAIKTVENKRYITRLQREYDQAKKLVLSLVRIEKLRHAVMELDRKTMAEIRSYSRPPKLVHYVMRASLLLLGDHEGKTKKWQNCQPRCKTIGPNDLLRRVRQFNLKQVHPEIAARSKEILQHFRLDDVRDKSEGAAAFYVWAVGMAEELTVLTEVVGAVTPADLTRQKEILTL
ncbi:hypothetical protein NP493_1243g00005 [Ridgeia piscesae]|uniref:Uncharacterized protein n=1 Tax=Ridgeia piscesae TaxID=27915 RepID=A0AAD9KBN7_RIDPI|nr:hypothetical protein NP493_1243g00005 [Ridgeia piscesae]